MKVLYSGILKAVIEPSDHDGFFIEDIEQALDDMGWPEDVSAPNPPLIPTPKGAWHITLIHQSILKPYRKELKGMEFPVPPRLPAITECSFGMRESGADNRWDATWVPGPDYRTSFVLWLPDPYQQQLKAYVRICMLMLGVDEGDPEPDRRFHISIANLTGKPKDSVR